MLTEIAKQSPEYVSPFVDRLPLLLAHTSGRARWESMHAIALTAHLRPDVVAHILEDLTSTIHTDKSVIVRDYAVDVVAGYARAGKAQSKQALPILLGSVRVWDSRHAAHALAGLANVVAMLPDEAENIRPLAQELGKHGKAAVRKSARALAKVCG